MNQPQPSPPPKQPEINLQLRFAEAEHLLKALEALPAESKTTVTHSSLLRKLSLVRDGWINMEKFKKPKKTVPVAPTRIVNKNLKK